MLFCLAALYFTVRGPWRAVGSVNSYDFASVDGAVRCWLTGQNPYDMRNVTREVYQAGYDAGTPPRADLPPMAYLPTVLPVLAPVAWLPWKAARLVWSLVSIGVFVLSAVLILRSCRLTADRKWILGAGLLLFSPTTSGLSTGNPSVISCGLTLAGIFLALEQRTLAAAMLLGLAHAIKPQISIAGLATILVWGYWRAAGLSFIVPVLAVAASFVRAGSLDRYRLWLTTLQSNIAGISQRGGMADPSPADYFSYHLVNEAAIWSVWLRDARVVTAVVWITAAILAGIYLWRRRQIGGDRRLRDIAFCCALALVPIYHRYYDAQLLLGMVPFLMQPAAKFSKAKAAIWGCLLVLLFPLQALVATSLPGIGPTSPAGFLLLRHQPVIILLLCLLTTTSPGMGPGTGEPREPRITGGRVLRAASPA